MVSGFLGKGGKRMLVTGATTGLVLAGLCCVSTAWNGNAQNARQSKSLGVLLVDGVNKAREFHNLPPTERREVTILNRCSYKKPPELFGHAVKASYPRKTGLYDVFDGEFVLKYWIAIAKDRSCFFVLGDSATPEDITAFLAYEGKASSGVFTVREALEFMEFWAACLAGPDEAYLVKSVEDLRRVFLLSGYTPERVADFMNELEKAMERKKIKELYPHQYEISPFVGHEMRFYVADTFACWRLYEVVIVYETSEDDSPPRIKTLSVRTIAGRRSATERFRQERRVKNGDKGQRAGS